MFEERKYQWAHVAFLCALTIQITTEAKAIDGVDEFATPDGQDAYGPTYKVEELPSATHDVLAASNPDVVTVSSGPVSCTVPGCVTSFMGITSSSFAGTSSMAGSAALVLSTCTSSATLGGAVGKIGAEAMFVDCDACEGGEEECGPFVEPQGP